MRNLKKINVFYDPEGLKTESTDTTKQKNETQENQDTKGNLLNLFKKENIYNENIYNKNKIIKKLEGLNNQTLKDIRNMDGISGLSSFLDKDKNNTEGIINIIDLIENFNKKLNEKTGGIFDEIKTTDIYKKSTLLVGIINYNKLLSGGLGNITHFLENIDELGGNNTKLNIAIDNLLEGNVLIQDQNYVNFAKNIKIDGKDIQDLNEKINKSYKIYSLYQNYIFNNNIDDDKKNIDSNLLKNIDLLNLNNTFCFQNLNFYLDYDIYKNFNINNITSIGYIISGNENILSENNKKDLGKHLGIDIKDKNTSEIYKEIKEILSEGIIGDDDKKMEIYKKLTNILPLYKIDELSSLPTDDFNKYSEKYQKKELLDITVGVDKNKLPELAKYLNKLGYRYNGKEISGETLKNIQKNDALNEFFLIKNINLDNLKSDKGELGKTFLEKIKINNLSQNSIEKINSLFEKDNINKIINDFSNSKGGNLIDFILNNLQQNGIFHILGANEKEKQYEIALTFQNILKDQIKAEKYEESINIIENNKDISGLIDKIVQKSNLDNSKKELFSLNIEYNLGKLIKKNKKELKNGLLTKNFLEKNKKELFYNNITNVGANQNTDIVSNIIDNIINKFPKAGIKIDTLITQLEKNDKKYEKILKSIDKVETLGYQGYIEYKEKQENEKKLLENIKGPTKENIDIQDTPFKGKTLSEDKIETVYEENNGIHTAYVKIPGEKHILKISDLTKEGVNKEILNTYLSKKIEINIDINGSNDQFNQIFYNKIDITKDNISENNLESINNFLTTFIYNNFFENGADKEKKFLKQNNINNPYLLFNDTKTFGKLFSQGLKKEATIGGFQTDIKGFKIDLSSINKNVFDENYQKELKEDILDGGKKENKSILSQFGNKIKSYFTS